MAQARKKANGEGSIIQRDDGLWLARVTLDGKRHAFYGRTKTEALKKANTARADHARGLPVANSRQTVAAYLGDWLEAVRPSLKAGTYERYAQYVRVYLEPHLGRTALARLSALDLERMYAAALASGLSARTVRHLHTVAHTALERAVRVGLVGRNVADAATPPRARRTEMKTLSREEAQRLLAAASGERLEALYVVALTTGMREGELLALKWDAVDLDGAVRRGRPSLAVRATLRRTKSGFVFEEPKTAGSRRTVTLPDAAVAALRRHRLAQKEERIKRGATWEDVGLVFANEVGRPIEAGNLLHRQFYPLLAKTGLRRVRFHDLRHTFATLALEQGVNVKQVSEMLGHSSPTITLTLYAHATETMQDQALAAVNAIFGT